MCSAACACERCGFGCQLPGAFVCAVVIVKAASCALQACASACTSWLHASNRTTHRHVGSSARDRPFTSCCRVVVCLSIFLHLLDVITGCLREADTTTESRLNKVRRAIGQSVELCACAGDALIQPLLDKQLKAASPLVLPPQPSVSNVPLDKALDIVKDAFTAAGVTLRSFTRVCIDLKCDSRSCCCCEHRCVLSDHVFDSVEDGLSQQVRTTSNLFVVLMCVCDHMHGSCCHAMKHRPPFADVQVDEVSSSQASYA